MKKDEIDLFVLFNILWQKRGLIIFSTLLVAILSIGISFLLPKSYKAQAIILSNSSQNSAGGLASTMKAFGFGAFVGSDSGQNSLLTILKSRKILELLNDKFDFQKRFKLKHKDTTIQELKKRMEIKTGEQEQIIISAELHDQKIVADVVNYTIECLDSLNIALANSNAKINRLFLEKRFLEVQDSLAYYEDKMANFMKQNKIISITDQMQYTIKGAAELQAMIDEKKIQLQLKQTMFDDNNFVIQGLKKEIKLLENNYKDNFETDSNGVYVNLENVTNAQLTYLRFKRMVEFYSQLLEFIAPQYEQAKIDEIKKLPTFQVIDYARTPDIKSKPKKSIIVMGSTFLYLIILLTAILLFYKQENEKE